MVQEHSLNDILAWHFVTCSQCHLRICKITAVDNAIKNKVKSFAYARLTFPRPYRVRSNGFCCRRLWYFVIRKFGFFDEFYRNNSFKIWPIAEHNRGIFHIFVACCVQKSCFLSVIDPISTRSHKNMPSTQSQCFAWCVINSHNNFAGPIRFPFEVCNRHTWS